MNIDAQYRMGRTSAASALRCFNSGVVSILDGDSAHKRRTLERNAEGIWDSGGPRQVALE